MLKISTGFSRKVGEPNFGSRGASVNLEIEIDSALIADPDRLHGKIRQLFALAKDSVDEELNGRGRDGEHQSGHAGSSNGNGDHHRQNDRNGRRATASQVRALFAIASRERIDLPQLVQERFQVDRAEDLSLRDASTLIDDLKNGKAAAGGRR